MLAWFKRWRQPKPLAPEEALAGVQTLAGLRETLFKLGRVAQQRAKQETDTSAADVGRVLLAVAHKLEQLEQTQVRQLGEPRLLLFDPDAQARSQS